MPYLDLANMSRFEQDEGVISNLIRKGWSIRPEKPSFDENTEKCEWNGFQWSTSQLSEEEIAEKNRKVWTPLEFMRRFTQEELAGIIIAAKNDIQIELFKTMLAATPNIHSDNPLFLQGVAYLVSQNLITQQRANEIMS